VATTSCHPSLAVELRRLVGRSAGTLQLRPAENSETRLGVPMAEAWSDSAEVGVRPNVSEEISASTDAASRVDSIAARTVVAALSGVAALLFVKSLTTPFVVAVFELELPTWFPPTFHARAHDWVLAETGFTVGPKFLPAVIRELHATDQFLAVIVAVFSFAFPILKMFVCLLGSLIPGAARAAARVANATAKWSMADVFIVALLVVLLKAEGLVYYFEAGPGVWYFGASAIVASVAATVLVHSQKEVPDA